MSKHNTCAWCNVDIVHHDKNNPQVMRWNKLGQRIFLHDMCASTWDSYNEKVYKEPVADPVSLSCKRSIDFCTGHHITPINNLIMHE